jgi:hypothetical protein
MLHADASPKPSPEGCTTNELRQEPPPVKPPVKKTAARCLHELQDPSSPPKPRKLYRTESTYGALVFTGAEGTLLPRQAAAEALNARKGLGAGASKRAKGKRAARDAEDEEEDD